MWLPPRSSSGKPSTLFLDALIVQAALLAGDKKLLSEDLQHGFISGVTVENPFDLI